MNICNISNVAIVFMDIDGTLKDLAKENTEALIRTMDKLKISSNMFRSRVVFWMNKVNMYLVKTGLLPTNATMQKVLLFFYSIVLFKSYTKFKCIYFKEYNKEDIFFDSAEVAVKKIFSNECKLYLITKNEQNTSIINSDFAGEFNKLLRVVIGKKGFTKYAVYKEFLVHRNYNKDTLVIIGDNFFDDVVPALLLGVQVIWCDMYNCKIKRLVGMLLRIFCKNIIMKNIYDI